jgi:hypothetical protein
VWAYRVERGQGLTCRVHGVAATPPGTYRREYPSSQSGDGNSEDEGMPGKKIAGKLGSGGTQQEARLPSPRSVLSLVLRKVTQITLNSRREMQQAETRVGGMLGGVGI